PPPGLDELDALADLEDAAEVELAAVGEVQPVDRIGGPDVVRLLHEIDPRIPDPVDVEDERLPVLELDALRAAVDELEQAAPLVGEHRPVAEPGDGGLVGGALHADRFAAAGTSRAARTAGASRASGATRATGAAATPAPGAPAAPRAAGAAVAAPPSIPPAAAASTRAAGAATSAIVPVAAVISTARDREREQEGGRADQQSILHRGLLCVLDASCAGLLQKAHGEERREVSDGSEVVGAREEGRTARPGRGRRLDRWRPLLRAGRGGPQALR